MTWSPPAPGLAYGLSEAARLLQESGRPTLVVCAEKFSDKIGTVRASRMIFGDSAGALVLGPASAGAPPDLEVFQTYASGPMSAVESIIWPNPAFDNSITVYGPEVRALADPDGRARSLLEAIDLVVPTRPTRPRRRRFHSRCTTPCTTGSSTGPCGCSRRASGPARWAATS